MNHIACETRRFFLRSISSISTAWLAAAPCTAGAEPERVPWPAGTELPRTKAPANATDCHHHIYESRFPPDPKAKLRPGDATVADYRLLEKRIGIARNVIVQPSTYGTDNRCLIEALRQFGLRATRGVAVVNTAVTDAELKRLDTAGVRGIRFNLVQAGATTPDMIEPLSKRIEALGWHIQINASPEQIVALEKVWVRSPVPVVFDHLGHVAGADWHDLAFRTISRSIEVGKGWVKLSGAYIDTKVGPPSYSDRTAPAKAYVKEAPGRLVWGSDWPHPTASEKPDDAILFDLLTDWAPDERTRTRILVENPARLYGF